MNNNQGKWMGVAAHYLTKDFELTERVLALRRWTGPRTSDTAEDHLASVAVRGRRRACRVFFSWGMCVVGATTRNVCVDRVHSVATACSSCLCVCWRACACECE